MGNSALIIVDVQKDFCEGGALVVIGGNKVAHRIGLYIEQLGGMYDEIVATMDYHEPWPKTNGGHFSDNPDFVDSWPPHCEADSEGSDLHPEVESALMEWMVDYRSVTPMRSRYRIFKKGLGAPDYSGFQGHNRGRQGLHEYLQTAGIKNVDVVGIAGDYCVRATALDAKRLGYTTNILPTMVASVNGPEGTAEAINALARL